MSDLSYSFSQMQIQKKRSSLMSEDDFAGRAGRMESDISYIKRDISDLKGDIKEYRNDIRNIQTEMKNDFRLLFGAIIAVTLGLAGIMAKGFGWI